MDLFGRIAVHAAIVQRLCVRVCSAERRRVAESSLPSGNSATLRFLLVKERQVRGHIASVDV
jgi:hypothetical protein